MANALCTNNNRDLWKEVHKTPKSKRIQPVSVDIISDEKGINFVFTNTYKILYNSIPYDRKEMESFKKRVHNKTKASNSVQYMMSLISCVGPFIF